MPQFVEPVGPNVQNVSVGCPQLYAVATTVLLAFAIVGSIQAADKSTKSSVKPAAAKETVRFSPAPSKDDKPVWDGLRKHLTFRWTEAPLKSVVADLAKETGLKVELDPAALAAAKISADLPISAEYEDADFGDVLAQTLSPRRLDFVVASGTLQITSRQKALESLLSRTYDLSKECRTPEAFRKKLDVVLSAPAQRDDWGDTGGYATLVPDEKRKTLAITHTHSDHARICRALGKSDSTKDDAKPKKK